MLEKSRGKNAEKERKLPGSMSVWLLFPEVSASKKEN
jgi:hypothetical protein